MSRDYPESRLKIDIHCGSTPKWVEAEVSYRKAEDIVRPLWESHKLERSCVLFRVKINAFY